MELARGLDQRQALLRPGWLHRVDVSDGGWVNT